MTVPAIRAETLTKRYGESVAVDGISFAIEPGSITGLLGGNGAGKTTTIGMIMGLVSPTAGRVLVFGADMARNPIGCCTGSISKAPMWTCRTG